MALFDLSVRVQALNVYAIVHTLFQLYSKMLVKLNLSSVLATANATGKWNHHYTWDSGTQSTFQLHINIWISKNTFDLPIHNVCSLISADLKSIVEMAKGNLLPFFKHGWIVVRHCVAHINTVSHDGRCLCMCVLRQQGLGVTSQYW